MKLNNNYSYFNHHSVIMGGNLMDTEFEDMLKTKLNK